MAVYLSLTPSSSIFHFFTNILTLIFKSVFWGAWDVCVCVAVGVCIERDYEHMCIVIVHIVYMCVLSPSKEQQITKQDKLFLSSVSFGPRTPLETTHPLKPGSAQCKINRFSFITSVWDSLHSLIIHQLILLSFFQTFKILI